MLSVRIILHAPLWLPFHSNDISMHKNTIARIVCAKDNRTNDDTKLQKYHEFFERRESREKKIKQWTRETKKNGYWLEN